MTKTSKTIIVAFFALFLVPAAANAMTFRSGDTVSIGKNEVIDGSLLAAGANLVIDGKINGDLICVGQSINVNGEVAGDVICAGQAINVNGKIGGSLRTAGTSLNLSGEVARNLMYAGASLNTTASSSVRWEMLVGAAAANLQGLIGRDLVGAATNVNLGGSVGRDVQLWLDSKKSNQTNLNLENAASIGGKLTYTAIKDANISDKAVIRGEIKRLEPKAGYDRPSRGAKSGAWLLLVLYWIVAVYIIGVIMVMLWGEETKRLLANFTAKTQASFGWGLVVLLLTPLICLLLLITVIGIPLAAVLGLFWLLAMGLSKLFVSIFIGQKLLERYWQAKKDSLYAATILGVAVCYLIFLIPIIGWLLGLLATIWGMGAIYLFFKKA